MVDPLPAATMMSRTCEAPAFQNALSVSLATSFIEAQTESHIRPYQLKCDTNYVAQVWSSLLLERRMVDE